MATIQFKSDLTKTENKCSKCNKEIHSSDLYCNTCGYPANYELIRKTINSLNLQSKSEREAKGIRNAMILIGLSEVFIGILNFDITFQLILFSIIGATFIGLSFRSKKEPLLIINVGVIFYIMALIASFSLQMRMPLIPFAIHLVILPLIINCYTKFKKLNKASVKLKKLQNLN